MKRLFTIAVALTFVGLNAIAADTATTDMSSTLHYGVHGGLNFGSMSQSPTDIANKSTETGVFAGALVEYSFTDMFAIQPEINFIQKGVSYVSGTTTITNRLNYLEVPILARANFNIGGIKPYVLAGPAIGFLLSGTSNPTGTDLKPFTKTIDLSIDLGAGVALAVAETVDVFVDVRYGIGLANTISNATSGNSAHNNGLILSAGLMF